jgi:hypothetical protein
VYRLISAAWRTRGPSQRINDLLLQAYIGELLIEKKPSRESSEKPESCATVVGDR